MIPMGNIAMLMYPTLLGLSIFFFFMGYRIKSIQKKKIDQLWNEIIKCKNCGQSNFTVLYSTRDSGESGIPERQDAYQSHTDCIEIVCNGCKNKMFYDSFTTGHNSDGGGNYDRESPLEVISPSIGSGITKYILREKYFSVDNSGCERSIFLILGYGCFGLLIFSLIIFFS